MANKVRYGLENVYYALIQEGEDETETYAAPKALPGAVALTVSPEGDSSTFHADNSAYFVLSSNQGYTGTLEIAALEDEAAADLLGEIKAANGIVYEDAAITSPRFALLFEIGGNVCEQRFALYDCTLTRSDVSANTTSDSTDPDTKTLNIVAIPHQIELGGEVRKIVKGSIENTGDGKAVYASWNTAVQLPAVDAA